MYSVEIVRQISFGMVKSAYSSSIITEEVLDSYEINERFSYLGTLFFVTFMNRTNMQMHQMLAYSYVKQWVEHIIDWWRFSYWKSE